MPWTRPPSMPISEVRGVRHVALSEAAVRLVEVGRGRDVIPEAVVDGAVQAAGLIGTIVDQVQREGAVGRLGERPRVQDRHAHISVGSDVVLPIGKTSCRARDSPYV